jgi:ATP-dependent RNA helicase DbpA
MTLAPTHPSFSILPLPEAAISNLTALGYLHMTPIQAASLPLALAGRDVLAQAQTGSGKTAAFALALLAKLNVQYAGTQALVLCPTRELAEQVTQEIRRLARYQSNTKTIALCGGVALRGQLSSLEHGAHIVVGTPGRIQDHLERQSLRLDALNTLVLDEADHMLDMGFFDAIAAIIKQCPRQRQTLLFSATYPDGIAKLSQQFLNNPAEIKLKEQHQADKICQHFYQIEESQRLHMVGLLVRHFRPVSTLAFCNTRQQCRDLVDVLGAAGISALALHGDMEQRDRDQVLVQFSNRSCSVLVATDVAARGLDIAQLQAVINVDIAHEADTHIHRIGRTGRAAEAGLALSLASMDDMGRVGFIEQAQKMTSQWHPVAELVVASGEPLLAPFVTLHIQGGRKEKIRAGDVLGALTGEAGFSGEQVGKITVNDFSTYVAVDRQIAKQALHQLAIGKIKGKRVKVQLL